MNLYLVHCGFYDSELCDGIYEGHANLFVAAASFEEARVVVKSLPEFQAKKMHVDGLQEIRAVGGHEIILEKSPELDGKTVVVGHRHRDFARPKPQASS